MKKLIFIVCLVIGITVVVYASTIVVPFDTENTRVDPGQVHTKRNTWVIIDSTTSAGDEPNDLAVTERTYQLAKNASEGGDAEISFYDVPRSWNGVRFRVIGITDGGTATYQIYLGTLGDGNLDSGSTGIDCDLAYAGQLAFVVGTQTSIYSQVAYTSGGTAVPVAGDTLTGATSDETAIFISDSISSGAYVDGDAAGTYTVRTQSGAFQSENLNLIGSDGVTRTNVATIGADMVRFEMADAVTVTASDWTKAWSDKSPGGERVAEASIDLMGADLIVAVPTTASADCKLIVKGF